MQVHTSASVRKTAKTVGAGAQEVAHASADACIEANDALVMCFVHSGA